MFALAPIAYFWGFFIMKHDCRRFKKNRAKLLHIIQQVKPKIKLYANM